MLDKAEFRKLWLTRRRAVPASERKAACRKINDTLSRWSIFQAAGTVMVFMAMNDEISLRTIIEQAWSLNKRVAVPQMAGPGNMEAVLINPDTKWHKVAFGIAEPLEAEVLPPNQLDLILLSGVAFDRLGNRLGMGGGYYDRFLLRAPQAMTAAVILAQQIHGQIPQEEHDRSVDYLVTEHEIVFCRAEQRLQQ